MLLSDLEWMSAQWTDAGAARAQLMANTDAGLSAILTGMGSLSYGEQAGERMRLGLMLNDPEEEHDCFSDNTHNSHYYDGLGARIQLANATSDLSLRNTSFGVLKPRHFLGRLFNLSMMSTTS